MSWHEKVEQYWYESHSQIKGDSKITPSLFLKIIHPFLIPVNLLYRFVVRNRNQFYNNPKNVLSVPCPVISIGNLTVGGVGKTPVTAFLCRVLSMNGLKVAVLSRGYGSKGPQPVHVSPESDWKQVGDEPFCLAKIFPEIQIVVDSDRVRGAQYALKLDKPDVILLDDGFQHRRLKRDSNWLLIDSNRFLGNEKLLPIGPLREPVSSLKRANFILLTEYEPKRYDDPNLPIKRVNRLCSSRGLDRPLATGKMIPQYLTPIENWNDKYPVEHFKDKPVGILIGTGNPGRIRETIQEMGCRIVSEHYFPDHHSYSQNDLKGVEKKVHSQGAEYILTTSKDAVRIDNLRENLSLPIFVLHAEFQIVSGKEKIEKELNRILNRKIQLEITSENIKI